MCQKLLVEDLSIVRTEGIPARWQISLNFFCNYKEVYFTSSTSRLVNKHGIGIRNLSGETEYTKKYFDIGKRYIRKAIRELKATNVQGTTEMLVENGKVYWIDPNFRTPQFSHLMMLKENGIDHAKESMKSFLDSDYTPKIELNERYVSMAAVKDSHKWSGHTNDNPIILAPNIKLIDNHGGNWFHGQTTTMQPKILIVSGSTPADSESLMKSYMKTLEYDILR